MTSALVPVGVVILIALSARLRAHFSVDAETRRRIFALHVKAALMVCFIVYPTTSGTIFEVLRPCQHFAYEGLFLPVDLSKRCGTATHLAFVLFGSAMLLVITCGVLIVFTVLLYKNRDHISPLAKDELAKIRVREANCSLDSISFLFKDYKCSCLYMETVEMLRRVVMVGGIKFCGEAGLRCGVGTMMALLSIFLYEHVMPYENSQTNLLACAAQVVVFFVYLAAFVIVTKPVTKCHTAYRHAAIASRAHCPLAVCLQRCPAGLNTSLHGPSPFLPHN